MLLQKKKMENRKNLLNFPGLFLHTYIIIGLYCYKKIYVLVYVFVGILNILYTLCV